jgi:adenosylcobinamide-GDP ribazoletransferase
MVLHIALLPYVRSAGLAAVFYQRSPKLAALWAVGLLAAVACGVLGLRGLVVWAACVGVTLVLAAYVRSKIGGATGDTFGAVCEIVEIVPALTLALWPLDAMR